MLRQILVFPFCFSDVILIGRVFDTWEMLAIELDVFNVWFLRLIYWFGCGNVCISEDPGSRLRPLQPDLLVWLSIGGKWAVT